jgi:hypothetical protein
MKLFKGVGWGIPQCLSLEASGSEHLAHGETNNLVGVLYEDQYEVLDFCNFN